MFTLEEKVGQMMMVGFHGVEAPDHILHWLAEGRIGGIILFSRNIKNPEQVAKLNHSLHAAAKYPIFISVDQEGGTVARLTGNFTESPGAMSLGAANDTSLAETMAHVMAKELYALGFNWNLAPVVDIAHDINNPVIGTRAFGTDAKRVSDLANAQIQGFQRAGVAACAKHFPGHGNTPVDTHVDLAVVDGSLDYLWEHDLVPFRAAVDAGIASVMVSHVKFTDLDAEYPSTLSPAITTKLLREEIGFKGLATSDCMEMKAIDDRYGYGTSAVLAVQAGMDTLFFSHTIEKQEAAYQAVLEAVQSGKIPLSRIDEAVERIQTMKAQFPAAKTAQLDKVYTPDHLHVSYQAAAAGITLHKSDNRVFPIKPDDNLALIEFASYMDSEVMEAGGLTGFATILHDKLPQIPSIALQSTTNDKAKVDDALQLASEAKTTLLITRNAHLLPVQLDLAKKIEEKANNIILICLRNPYDALVLTTAKTVLFSYGDSTPSMQAVTDVLLGKVIATGKSPVPVQ